MRPLWWCRDVTSIKTLKYKYKYKYPSFKYKYKYLVYIASTDKVHERRCKQKLWNRQSSSASFNLFYSFWLLTTQAHYNYDDILYYMLRHARFMLQNIHIRHVRYMHTCQQVLRPQVQVPKPQVQIQVLQTCTQVQLEYKYKYQVHISVLMHWLAGRKFSQR